RNLKNLGIAQASPFSKEYEIMGLLPKLASRRNKKQNRTRSLRPRHHSRNRLWLEHLEDRTLLSVYTDLANALDTLKPLETLESNIENVVNTVQHIPLLDQAGDQLGNILNNSNNPLMIATNLISTVKNALNQKNTDQDVQNAILGANLPAVQNVTVTSNNQ